MLRSSSTHVRLAAHVLVVTTSVGLDQKRRRGCGERALLGCFSASSGWWRCGAGGCAADEASLPLTIFFLLAEESENEM